MVAPLGYLDFIALEAGRPITVSEGTNRVVGRDPERIVAAAHRALSEELTPRRPGLWDGRASQRIAEVLVGGGGPTGHARPTGAGLARRALREVQKKAA